MKKKFMPLVMPAAPDLDGVASLQMVLQYFGKNIALERLCQQSGADVHRLDAEELEILAQKYGCTVQQFKSDSSQQLPVSPPFIICWNTGYFAVLTQYKRRGYLLHDPYEGAQYFKEKEFWKRCTGRILYIQPAPSFEPDPINLSVVLRTLLQKQGSATLCTLVCILLLSVIQVVYAVLLKLFIGGLFPAGSQWTQATAYLLIIVATLQLAFHGIIHALTGVLAKEGQSCFDGRLPLYFLHRQAFGNALLAQGEEAVKSMVRQWFPQYSRGCLWFVPVMFMCLYHIPLTGFLMFLTIIFAIAWHGRKQTGIDCREWLAALQQAEDSASYLEIAQHLEILKLRKPRQGFAITILACVEATAFVAVIAKMLQSGSISIATVFSFCYLAVIFFMDLFFLHCCRQRRRDLQQSYARAQSILWESESQAEPLQQEPLQWQAVCYRPYLTGEELLHDISFRMKEGVCIITGEHASLIGKLCVGECRNTSGTIYYGGAPLQQIPDSIIRKKMIRLSKEETTPKCSVLQYLCGDGNSAYRAVACALCLHPLVVQAGGYQQPIEALTHCGWILAQIAKAILKEPELLVLDHMLCHLDRQLEAAVMEVCVIHGIHLMVITEQDSLCKQFQQILLIEDKTVSFQGTQDEWTWRESVYERDGKKARTSIAAKHENRECTGKPT